MRYDDVLQLLEETIAYLDDSTHWLLMEEDKVMASVDSIFAARENIVKMLEFLNELEIHSSSESGKVSISK